MGEVRRVALMHRRGLQPLVSVYDMGLKQEGGISHTFFMLEGEAITLGSGVERATESSLLPHPKRKRPDVE